MTRKKLDPETDELMWAAAESPDPQDWAEFERRFPDLRAEFATRRAMVDVLRKSKPTASRISRAAFRPAPSTPTAFWKRAAIIPAAAVLLVALAFGAYQITLRLTPHPKPRQAATVPASPSQKHNSTAGGTRAPQTLNQQPEITQKGLGQRPPEPAATTVTVRLKAGGITLFQALDEVSRQGRVKIMLTPGVSDQPVQLGPDPAAILELSVASMLAAIERAAPVRIIDNGPEGFIIAPLERVDNVPAQPAIPSPSGSDGSSTGGQ